MSSTDVAAARLAATDDAALAALGLAGDDLADARRALDDALADPEALALIAATVAALRERLGRLPVGYDAVDPEAGTARGWPSGVLGLLAIVAAADDVRAAHRSRGVPADVSAATLADLGRQVAVHRRTFGSFGLHTADWEGAVHSGGLFALGRLQFELAAFEGRPVLSVHIPESGPLTPAAVDDAFARALAFFPEHFPDVPLDRFHCHSWLLDPNLAAALDPASNTARFQRRWTLVGEPEPGDEDALFFTFRRRGAVDLDRLPRETTLQRAVVDRIRAGGHWSLRRGVIPFTDAVAGAA